MADSPSNRRLPHAVLELSSRRPKAQKIERLLKLASRCQPLTILEIGCGSGGIAHYFATHPELECHVTAVDAHDNRQILEGYEYRQVSGVGLPFETQSFDVVITNHVIEHVGEKSDQIRHLTEIRRVPKTGGIGYLAVPNRWMITEPHYRVKFLSWLPRGWRSPYLRRTGKGDYYDCEPLEMGELEDMLKTADLSFQNLCIEGWKTTFELERGDQLSTRLLAAIPDVVLKPLRPLIPTLIYRVERTA